MSPMIGAKFQVKIKIKIAMLIARTLVRESPSKQREL
jgi:hypothetical protein